MRLPRVLFVASSLCLLGAAVAGANACGGSVAGSSDAGSGNPPGGGSGTQVSWTVGATPSSGAIVAPDACAALADCCAANEAGDLYCSDVSSNCDDAFQYELNYGYCSGYIYVGFVANTGLSEPSDPGGSVDAGNERCDSFADCENVDAGREGEDGSSGFSDGGSGFTDASVPPSGEWTPDVEPGADAIVETDACSALADCCTADDAGDLYCADVSSECDTNFQLELNYGFCSGYTYVGYTVIDVGEPSSPGEPPPGSQGDAG